jgi:hypothetical protein
MPAWCSTPKCFAELAANSLVGASGVVAAEDRRGCVHRGAPSGGGTQQRCGARWSVAIAPATAASPLSAVGNRVTVATLERFVQWRILLDVVGGVLELPDAVLGLSPFRQLPAVPAVPLDWTPLVAITAGRSRWRCHRRRRLPAPRPPGQEA